MHEIRFPLGLRPRPRYGGLQHSPGPLAGFKGPTCKEREWRKDGTKGKGRGRGRNGKGRDGRKKGRGE